MWEIRESSPSARTCGRTKATLSNKKELGLPVGEFPTPLDPKMAAQVLCSRGVLASMRADMRTMLALSFKKDLGLPVGEFLAPLRPKTPLQVWKIHVLPPSARAQVRTELTLSSKQLEMEFKKELKSQL